MRLFGTSLAALGLLGMSALPIAAQELETADSSNKNANKNVVVSSQGIATGATAGSMAGGLGTAAAIGGGALLLGVAALSGDSSTPSTSGTN